MFDEPLSQGPQASDLRYRLLHLSDEKSREEEDESQLGGQQTYVGCVLFRPWTTIVILLMVLITNLILLSTSVMNVVASHTSTFNRESSIHTSFSQDRALQSLDHAYDNMWEALSLNKTSAGLIHDADSGVNAGNGAIAMFHQIHCLTMLRKALQSSVEGKNIGVDWHDDDHWPHCMDYLVKTIICFADDTIERPLRRLDGGLSIDGSNAVRECRPPQPLYSLYSEKGL